MHPRHAIRFTRLDALLLLVLACAAGWLVWRVTTVLGYDWDWTFLGRTILRRSEDGSLTPGLLLKGFVATLRLAAWTMLLALIAGVAAGLCRVSRSLFLRLCARTYVETMRNTPPLVLVFLFYFFVGDWIMTALGAQELAYQLPEAWQERLAWIMAPPGKLAAFLSALATLALYEGAYIAEIVRSGVQSIERGQWEAAYALGLSRWQRMTRVVLPQALRRMVPPLAGQFISTIKDSSIVAVISIPELTFEGLELMAATYRTFEIWLTVLGLYLLACLACSLAARRLETRLARRAA
ncbi:amino acid ABC transporter membrane protein 2, PAAT family [Desulfocurvibacter africanus PCS]|uniref:Amino acid ABC transporter membrane protein 2, PAAT family n=1 Tax=Desulfocurvibacter africanus PCS TaxID=1262666 RepID=M5PSR9_DESAF|nr:amino acid ABC transporter permease [Desulfocurvibacter africanus]EMG37085.1 amino acid ABC transporter membrane protein 2, PAAT family [Desulfocurvibacter africanus PCS]